MPDLDVLIPTVTALDGLLGALDSLLIHDPLHGEGMRVLVLNNGLPGRLAGFSARDPIEVVEMGRNVGWTRAIAAGIDQTDAPLILLMNDDVRLLQGPGYALRRLMARFDDPAVSAVGATTNEDDHFQAMSWAAPAPYQHQALWSMRVLKGFFLLVRRTHLERAGGIDVAFEMADDFDLSYRLSQHGGTLLLDREAFVYHRGGATGRAFYGPEWNGARMREQMTAQLQAKHGATCMAWCGGLPMPYQSPGLVLA